MQALGGTPKGLKRRRQNGPLRIGEKDRTKLISQFGILGAPSKSFFIKYLIFTIDRVAERK